MKKCNEFYTYYNKKGLKAKIKVTNKALEKKNTYFIIKFMRQIDDDWLYHYPDKKFSCHLEVINYILKNLESNNVKFKVV